MPKNHLEIYLNDHLSGSALALELLGKMRSAYPGTDAERVAMELEPAVAEDRDTLKDLMARLQVPQSLPRQAAAWISEKLLQVKLRVDDPAGDVFRLLEMAEGISLGIEGKKSLWAALSAAAEVSPLLAGIDFKRLIERAEEQRGKMEAVRLNVAKQALG